MFIGFTAEPKSQVIVPLLMLSAVIALVIQTKQLTGEDSRVIVTPIFRFSLVKTHA